MDRVCQSCEKDPGKGSTCRHCGARVYRFAVDHDEWAATAEDGFAVRDATGPSDKELVGDAFADLDITPSAAAIEDLLAGTEPEEILGEPEQDLRPWPPASAPEQVSADPVSQPRRGCGCTGCLGVFIFLVLVIGALIALVTSAGMDDFPDMVEDFLEEAGFVEAVEPDVSGAGPCLDLVVEGSIVSETVVVPCSGPHDAEQYHVELLEGVDFPGADVLASRASSACFDRFEGYVGNSYAASIYYYDWLVPTEEGWGAGDRDLVCVLVSGDGEPLVGAGKDSGR